MYAKPRGQSMNRSSPTTIRFLRVLEADDKASALLALVRNPDAPPSFGLTREDLAEVPRTPFAYWLSASVRTLFLRTATFSGCGLPPKRHSKQGLATSNDARFIRSWFEVEPRPERWRPIAKGRTRNPLYADIPEVITWEAIDDPARELKAYVLTKPGNNHWSRRLASVDFYGRPGVTWPVRASRFSPRPLPAGAAFSHRGYSAFTDIDDDLMALIAWGSSSIVDFMYKASLGRFGYPEFLVGVLKSVPFPSCDPLSNRELSELAHESWSIRRGIDSSNELSLAFVLPSVLQVAGVDFRLRSLAWANRVARADVDLLRLQAEIDKLCFDLYGISEADRTAITKGFDVADDDEDMGTRADGDDETDTAVEVDPVVLAAALVSWAVGVVAGRFDVRLATGERDWPAVPSPFDPLPACSAGMLTGRDGLPPLSPPDRYPLSPSPLTVDDPGHKLDLTERVRRTFEIVFGDKADSWWTDVGVVLDGKSGVEGWIRQKYFDFHLEQYSKPSRKAPIMWPIGTTSGSYRVWLYAHQVTNDTLFRVVGDLVEPKLAVEQRRLSDLTQEFGPSPSASQRRGLSAQQTLVDELIELRDQLRAVAPLWSPNLNDGIVIVLAPLWRLFAHHRAWSKELKDRWTKLAKGEYDWAQLAMHIWPERVIPKCAEDRSLAIAHDLEDTFWARDATNADKWHPRRLPTTPIDQLIAERTNPTIDAARNHPNP